MGSLFGKSWLLSDWLGSVGLYRCLMGRGSGFLTMFFMMFLLLLFLLFFLFLLFLFFLVLFVLFDWFGFLQIVHSLIIMVNLTMHNVGAVIKLMNFESSESFERQLSNLLAMIIMF